MTPVPAPFDRVTAEATSLQRSHPQAPALDVLDLVMQGQAITPPFDPSAPWLAPATPLGQLIAAALDPVMTPEEWRSLTAEGNEPALVDACQKIWITYVIPRFVSRYCDATNTSAKAPA